MRNLRVFEKQSDTFIFIYVLDKTKDVKSRTHQLKCLDSGWMEFPRASVVDFILRDRDLGKDPLQIQLWHDNSGKGEDACWYRNNNF